MPSSRWTSAAARSTTALGLATQHRAPFLVISLGTPGSGYGCPRPVRGGELICFNPSPGTTQGEAEFAGRLARKYHWHSIAVVTITPQDSRARLRLERCFAGPVYVVTAPIAARSPGRIRSPTSGAPSSKLWSCSAAASGRTALGYNGPTATFQAVGQAIRETGNRTVHGLLMRITLIVKWAANSGESLPTYPQACASLYRRRAQHRYGWYRAVVAWGGKRHDVDRSGSEVGYGPGRPYACADSWLRCITCAQYQAPIGNPTRTLVPYDLSNCCGDGGY